MHEKTWIAQENTQSKNYIVLYVKSLLLKGEVSVTFDIAFCQQAFQKETLMGAMVPTGTALGTTVVISRVCTIVLKERTAFVSHLSYCTLL